MSWGRIRSVSEELDCFVSHRLERGWCEWRRSLGSVFATVSGLEVEGAFCCILGRLEDMISRFLKCLL